MRRDHAVILLHHYKPTVTGSHGVNSKHVVKYDHSEPQDLIRVRQLNNKNLF